MKLNRFGKNHQSWKGGKVKVKCKQCEKEFHINPSVIKIGGGKFCSRKCQGLGKITSLKISCNVCGRLFYIKKSRFKNAKYCSVQCLSKFNNKQVKRICKICGKEFSVTLSHSLNGEGIYCSKKCMGKAFYKKQKIICKTCRKTFYLKPSAVKTNSGKFCSRKCSQISHTGKGSFLYGKKDENSLNWKGGITPINIQIRQSLKYKQWRKSVFERDKYTCKKCGQIGRNLHAHHIKKFSVIINDIKQKYPLLSLVDIAEQYPNMWNIKNGVTLCDKCHKLIHRRINDIH